MTLSEFIIRYREKHSLSQRQFAKLCNLSNTYISTLERGRKNGANKPIIPTIQAYAQIADGVGMTMQELFELIDDSPVSLEREQQSDYCIPIVGRIACGLPTLAVENIDGYIELPRPVKADFALIARGDSMINARIFDGDYVFIHQQPDVEDGEIAAVMIGDDTTLKKVKHYPNRLVLIPCNPLYDEQVYREGELDDVEIIGKAVWILGEIK